MGNRGSRGVGYKSNRQTCPQCGRSIAVGILAGSEYGKVRYRRHNKPDGSKCPMGGLRGARHDEAGGIADER